MKIKNYLLDLDNPIYVRKGSDNIRIYGVGKHIKKIYQDIKKLKKVKEINCEYKDPENIYNWILGKSGVSIKDLYDLLLYWRDSCKKSNSEFMELWDLFFTNSEFLPERSIEQAQSPIAPLT